MKKAHYNIEIIITSNMISSVGSWISRIATMTLALQIYGTAMATSMVSAANIIPYIIFSPLAGKVADRGDKKKILIVGNLLNALLSFSIPLFKEKMIFAVFAISSITAFTSVCNNSIIPFLVHPKEINHLNSINSSMSSAVMVFGPSLSGILIAFLKIDICFIIDAISFLFASLLLNGLQYMDETQHTDNSINKNEISFLSTLKYIKTVPQLYSVILTIAAIGLAGGMLNSLLIIYVYNYMNVGSAEYGILLSFKGFSMLLASVLIYKIGEKIPSEQLFCYSLVGLGIALIAFPLNTSFKIGLIIQSINGICNAGYSIARVSLIQLTATRERIGRVFSVNSMLSNILSVTSLGIFGTMADYIGVRSVLLIGGFIVLMVAIFSTIHIKKFGIKV